MADYREMAVEFMNKQAGVRPMSPAEFAQGVKEAEEQFTLYNFVRVHKSYIVNLRHVTKVDANDVEVNGERIPLGRVYRHTFLQAFLRFVNAK